MVETHIRPDWGDRPVGRITRAAVKEWLGRKRRTPAVRRRLRGPGGELALDEADQQIWVTRPLSASRIRALAFCLHAILQHAVDDGAIRVNVAEGLDLPPVPAVLIRAVPPAKVAVLRAHLAGYGPDTATLAAVMAFGGGRWSEYVGMDVSDFDGDRTLWVRQPAVDVNGRLVRAAPKSHRQREIVLPKAVGAAVKELAAGRTEGPLFRAPRGGRWRRTTWNRRWEQATVAAGLPGMRPHDLRHCAVSLAISKGADIKVVQALVGHAKASTTTDLYGHLFPGRLAEVADAMEDEAAAPLPDVRPAAQVEDGPRLRVV